MTNFRLALEAFREQRGRFTLSAVGVMVGTLAVVLLISIAIGVRADVTSEVEGLGVNLLIVVPGRIEEGNFNPNIGGQSFLSEANIATIRQIPGVRHVTSLTFAGGGVKYGDKEEYPMTVATTPEWFDIHDESLVEGRVMALGDADRAVCVIGSIAKEALFGSDSAVGKKVKINAREYEVIGVTADKKKEGGANLFSMFGFENMVYVPYAHFKAREKNVQIDRIALQTAPEAEPKSLKAAVETALGKTLNRQQYSVLTQEDLLGLVYKLMGILTWLLTGLTSIALFVGGVGIMTVMLMSVNERAREIGIRKTVGARRSDIFAQFLSEAILITTSGGVMGLLLSWLACFMLYTFTPVKPMITVGTVALALGMGIGVGAVFGLIPAIRAARKDPIVAMRSE